MKDLTTKDGRIAAIEEIEQSLKNQLFDFGFSPHTTLRISETSIEIGIEAPPDKKEKGYKIMFCSEITVYPAVKDFFTGIQKEEINFGTSGKFSPEDLAPYWRTKHACIVLDNWLDIMQLCKKYCERYAELNKEIQQTI